MALFSLCGVWWVVSLYMGRGLNWLGGNRLPWEWQSSSYLNMDSNETEDWLPVWSKRELEDEQRSPKISSLRHLELNRKMSDFLAAYPWHFQEAMPKLRSKACLCIAYEIAIELALVFESFHWWTLKLWLCKLMGGATDDTCGEGWIQDAHSCKVASYGNVTSYEWWTLKLRLCKLMGGATDDMERAKSHQGCKAVSYGNVTGYEDGSRNLRHRCQLHLWTDSRDSRWMNEKVSSTDMDMEVKQSSSNCGILGSLGHSP